jgi:UDP-3-O-[3-hydroxymyristoyl] glucosamine N-acyltransferase
VLGRDCLVHPGAVIGADGFGYAKDGERWVKQPQLGRVTIGDEVEIGANTTIDRGALGDTIVGHGVKLDNLIQIAHNVRIGDHTAIAACVGIAGSAVIGRRCTIGGQTGIAGHIEIADDVHVTACSLVTVSITEPGSVYSSAIKAVPAAQWRRNAARLYQLDELARRLRRLEENFRQPAKEQKT